MPPISIIPKPVRLTPTDGAFALTPDTIIAADEAALAVAGRCCEMLAPVAAFTPIALPGGEPAGRPLIQLRLDPALAHLGAEGYRLTVSPQEIAATAAGVAGLLHAIQTLRQLLPAAAYDAGETAGDAWLIPCVQIEDFPRFGWRGAMLDVCRHFMPLPFVLKFIDLLALHKLNVFHWHLTEDQGWRIEIERYPRLTEVGAWRSETAVGHWREFQEHPTFDATPHGGFYTQDEARQVVAYAAARGVTVVPEIEMPGHAQAALAAYPELGNTGRQLAVGTYWGIYENVFNVEEGTLRFLQNVLDEVMDIFPGQFIHIGGDEAPKEQWQESQAAQARLKALGLPDEAALQSYFVGRMDAFLAGRGRRLVGWDEILEGGLAPGATVMSWRGEEGGVAAARAGHDVIMAPTQWTYLDYYQSEHQAAEPLAIGGHVPLAKVYGYEPIPAALAAEQAHHVLGTQGQLWTEYMPTPAHVEYMAFPRLCALAETAWTPAAAKDYADFLGRLPLHLERLRRLGVNFRPLD
jgi:hexosaminidase